MPAHVRDIVLGRPTATGAAPVVIQLLLILTWHVAMLDLAVEPVTDAFLSAVTEYASRSWDAVGVSTAFVDQGVAPSPTAGPIGLFALPLIALPILLAVVALEGMLAGALFFVLVPRSHASIRMFMRSWWRACVWATLLFCGLVVAFFVFVPLNRAHWAGMIVVNAVPCGYALFAPTFFGRQELKVRRRLASWRPVCPECGYSLRRLRADRCPECGVAFPTKSRVFRRWAIQRLIWDRAGRGSLVFAYVRTLLAVTFCPCRAGRRLAMPDRYGRACRWAVGHVALVACVGLALGQDCYFLNWTLRNLGPGAAAFRSMLLGWGTPSAGRVAIWAGQTYTAWLVALVGLPLLGALLGTAMAWRHPVARRGIAKWSLYATAIHVPAAIVWYGLQLGVGRA